MKKMYAFLFFFTALAGMVLSQEEDYSSGESDTSSVLSINSFGYVSFEPLQMVFPENGDAAYYAGSGVPWGDKSKVTLLFELVEPQWRFGGKIGLEKEYGENISPRIIDTASVWIRPFHWAQIEVGSFEYEELQGSYNGTDFSLYLGPTEGNEGGIFQKFKGVNGTGVMLSFSPMTNLFLGMLVNPLIGARADNYDRQPITAKDVYENGQYGLAYTFPNTGTVRLQYIGGSKSRPNLVDNIAGYEERSFFDMDSWKTDYGTPIDPSDPDSPMNVPSPDYTDANYWTSRVMPVYNPFYNSYPVIVSNYAGLQNPMSVQAAFAFRKINNLVLDAGFTYPLLIEDTYGSTQRPLKLAAAAVYSGNPLTISGRIDFSFGGWSEFKQPSKKIFDGLLNDPFNDDAEFPQGGYQAGYDPIRYYLDNYLAIDYGFAINVSIAASYSFGFATIGAEFAMRYGAKDSVALNNPDQLSDQYNPQYDNERFSTGFGAWIMKNMGAASIKAGIAVSPATKNSNVKLQDEILNIFNLDQYEKGPMVITIPIVFGYWL